MTLATSVEDHYSVLGVSAAAKSDEVKAAYRSLSRQFHPDKVGLNADEAVKKEHASMMVKVNVAFQALYSKLRGKESSKDSDSNQDTPQQQGAEQQRRRHFKPSSLAPTAPLTLMQRQILKSLNGPWRNNNGTYLGSMQNGSMNWHQSIAADPNELTMDGDDYIALPFQVDGQLLAHRGKLVTSGGVTSISWKNNEFWLGPDVWVRDTASSQVRSPSDRPATLLAKLDDSRWRDAEGTEIGLLREGRLHWDEALDFPEASEILQREGDKHGLVLVISRPEGPEKSYGSVCFAGSTTITWDDGHVWVMKNSVAPHGCIPESAVFKKMWRAEDDRELIEL